MQGGRILFFSMTLRVEKNTKGWVTNGAEIFSSNEREVFTMTITTFFLLRDFLFWRNFFPLSVTELREQGPWYQQKMVTTEPKSERE